MTIELKHTLGQAESIGRIKRILIDLKNQHSGLVSNAQEIWKGNTANIQCEINKYDFSGTVQCLEHQIKIDLKVPLLANIFKSKIKSEIEKYVKDYLS
jgi:hypothetical protein